MRCDLPHRRTEARYTPVSATLIPRCRAHFGQSPSVTKALRMRSRSLPTSAPQEVGAGCARHNFRGFDPLGIPRRDLRLHR